MSSGRPAAMAKMLIDAADRAEAWTEADRHDLGIGDIAKLAGDRDCLGPEHRIELVDGRPERFCEPAFVHLVASSGGLAPHGFRNAARLVPNLGQTICLGGCRHRALVRNVCVWWVGGGRAPVIPAAVRKR